MPHGAEVDVTGTLVRHGRRLMLELPAGGAWQIDPPMFYHAKRLLGHRVRVIGERGGFDLIDAARITQA